ncbi:MAG: hypothetical protein Q8L52_00570 [bacterium]|nr:hypothetical protein [bacterium]
MKFVKKVWGELVAWLIGADIGVWPAGYTPGIVPDVLDSQQGWT